MLEKAFSSINLKNKALDGSWLRNSLISNNLANANTPGYKRQDVDFQQVLQNYLGQGSLPMMRTNPVHLPLGQDAAENLSFSVQREYGTSARRDDNNVNVDVEMAELAKNQLYYTTVVDSVNGDIRRLRTAIREGR